MNKKKAISILKKIKTNKEMEIFMSSNDEKWCLELGEECDILQEIIELIKEKK